MAPPSPPSDDDAPVAPPRADVRVTAASSAIASSSPTSQDLISLDLPVVSSRPGQSGAPEAPICHVESTGQAGFSSSSESRKAGLDAGLEFFYQGPGSRAIDGSLNLSRSETRGAEPGAHTSLPEQ